MSNRIINPETSDVNPKDKFYDHQLLTEAERHKILHEWNSTTTEYPHDRCIHQLFEEQVERTPHAVALVFEGEQLTYRELNARANQLAHYLQALGVGPEVLVGICVERSFEMIVGLLGVLKAGGAYVPLDPTYPLERLGFMLEDSSVPVLLTQSKLVEELPSHSARVVYLDKDWEEIAQQSKENSSSSITSGNLAYVIYTSGSTGKPKGVLLEHSGLCNLAIAEIQLFDIQPNSRVLQFASFSFDVATSDVVIALSSGATLYLATKDSILPGSSLIEVLRDKAITHVELPVSVLNVLPFEELPALQTIVVGGEACSSDLVARWVPGRQFFNAYGPTEATVCATVALCNDGSQKPPIGRPIANTKIYILDTENQPVPVGVPGELHIGGVGLARGYLNRPDLTDEKFIPNPFSNQPGSRLYKTGDLARYLPDGNIEYLGRIDNQVKIRGFRIELGEIEALLGQHPEVLETVIVVSQDVTGRKYLVAYIVPKNSKAISRSDLRGFLLDKLPDYMIPGVFITLDALPLTPNGKVDRKGLQEDAEKMAFKELEIEQSDLKINISDRNKQEDTELKNTRLDSISSKLRSLVAKLLHISIEEIDISATFLELGIDSLLLLEAMRIIQTTFRVQVEAQQFFEELETIDALATYIEQNMPLEPAEKTYEENDLYPISEKEADLNFTKTFPQLAQTKVLNAPGDSLIDKTMNQFNKDKEQQTNIEKIIAQQLQLMSQQLEVLRTEQLQKGLKAQAKTSENPSLAELSYISPQELKPQEKITFTEFASPKSFEQFDQSVTASNSCPVCSYNEWDLLEEVIVGIVDGAMIPSWHTIHRATVLPGQEKQMESLAKRTQKQPLPYPEWLVQAASKCVEEFAHILESEGVIVRRPDVVDYSASFGTPDWEVMNGFCSANPRDVFLVIGNEIIEAPMADRSRYFESWAYRSLLKEYLKGGAKWVAAPKPQLLDAQYDPDYKTPANGEEMRYVITEFEPTFDAADFVRFGRDIFVQKSHVTNSLGIEWVRRHLGEKYRVHEVQSLCPQALHIDTTLVPLAPGKVLVNPLFIDVDNLPDYFKSWDILLAPKPNRTPMTLYDTKVISQWVNMNVLSLDEERVIVEKSQESMIQSLKDWGFKPIPCEFESYYPFMGSFHCATLDVRRRGVLRSYEMEEGAL
jgi:amino acid adenylation domain-containing protein